MSKTNTDRSVRAATLGATKANPPNRTVVRSLAVTAGFLLVPALLMSFTHVPETPLDKVARLQTQHMPITAVFTPIDREQLVTYTGTDVNADVPMTLSAPTLELRSNEFTRHLNVVSLNSATNAARQISTNTTHAFAGRIDQSLAFATELTDTPSPERFRPLITYVDLGSGSQPIPNVRCMGLSPRSVHKRAKRYSKSVEKLAARYSIDANLVRAVMTRESCFDNSARSYVGAMGLMQLMPETAAWLKVEDPTDARQNLRAGVRYLASLKKRFGTTELALAAYNAGPGNVKRYNGIPPFKETRYYVKSVMSHYRSYAATEQFTNAVALN